MAIHQKIKTGIETLDALLGGGLPHDASILVIGSPKSGKKPLMMQFAYEGLKMGTPAIIVLTDYSYENWKEMMALGNWRTDEFEKKRMVRFIDAYSKQFNPEKEDTDACTYPEGGGALNSISLHISRAETALNGNTAPRVLFHSLSSLLEASNAPTVFRFLQFLIGKFRNAGSMSIYSLEKGMHDEKDITTIESLMDGIIEFEDNKLRVRGIIGADPKWHEFKIGRKGFEILGVSGLAAAAKKVEAHEQAEEKKASTKKAAKKSPVKKTKEKPKGKNKAKKKEEKKKQEKKKR